MLELGRAEVKVINAVAALVTDLPAQGLFNFHQGEKRLPEVCE